MSISNKLSFCINSISRTSGTSSNFNININIPDEIKKQITHVSITQISIPKSYYQIQSGYNTFYLYENSIQTIITMPPGNYSKVQLYYQLALQMTANSQYSIIYSFSDESTYYTTGRLKISANNPANRPIQIQAINNDMYSIIGLEPNIIYSFTTNNTLFISPNIINLNSLNNLYLHCNCINNNSNDIINGSDVLTIIYGGANPDFSYIINQYDMISNMKEFVNVPIYNFNLSDEKGEPINLNEINLSFILNFFTYTPNYSIYNKISNFINLELIKN